MAKRTVHKSAKDGRFVSAAKARKSPTTTYKTRVSTPKRKRSK